MSDSILLLGSSGFIGGHILYLLLKTPNQSIGHISAPVSSENKASQIRNWLKEEDFDKVKVDLPVISRSSETQWYEAIKNLAGESDITVNAATSDDLQLTKAINEGLHHGRESRGKKGSLVHLSGVQVIEGKPIGKYVEVPLYDDSDVKSIASIPETAAHREIDLEIINATTSGYIWGSIVCPALVWGRSKGPIAHSSHLVPDIVKKSLKNGHGTFVGEGTNTWVHVSVNECAKLVTDLIQHHSTQPKPKSIEAFSTFYFASNNDHRIDFKWIATEVASFLHKKGLIRSPEPKSVPCPPYNDNMTGIRFEEGNDEAAETVPVWPCRTNTNCVAKRGELTSGWVAKDRYDSEAIRADISDFLTESKLV